jgi:methylenetetrahydrofolate dehydrogenase (NADP+)/methenyltetrahydrofolate cyclohydrolase
VGENPESEVYINQKKKFGESIGVIVNIVKLDQDVKEGEIIKIIKDNNESDKVNGIIVQLPLPENLNNKEVRQRIINSILPEKDVDGLGIVQKSKFYNKDSKAVLPATARGIVSLLDFYREVIGEISGKNIVVVGRSDLVGKPTALSLLYRDATVTICHSKTRNLENITKNGDFLVIACGVARLIGKQHVREGQIVIDVGIHKTKDGFCF